MKGNTLSLYCKYVKRASDGIFDVKMNNPTEHLNVATPPFDEFSEEKYLTLKVRNCFSLSARS